jgi:hypothetical protein
VPRESKKYIYITIAVGLLLISLLAYISIRNVIRQTELYIQYQQSLFEDEVKETIEFYKVLMLTLAKNLETLSLDKDKDRLNKILESFRPLGDYVDLLKFNAFIIIDKDYNSIASSSMRWGTFQSYSYQGTNCIKGVKEHPYQLILGNIAIGKYSRKLVIPLGMGFNDSDGKYNGSICTGLILEDLEKEILNKSFDNTISAVNISSAATEINKHKIALHSKNNLINPDDMEALNIFFKLFSQEEITISHQLATYPYKLELVLNKKNILNQILKNLIINITSILLYTFISFVIYCYIRKYLLKPLSYIVEETSALAKQYNILNHISNSGYDARKQESHSITLLYSFVINIKTYLDLKDKEEKKRLTEYKERLFEEQKLKMMLLVRHYNREPESLIGDISAEYLIKSHIKQLVKGDNFALRISWFMNEIRSYLQDILDISIVIDELNDNNKQKLMIDKYAINQILYNIFSFAAYFDQTDTNKDFVLQYLIEPNSNNLQFTILIPLFKEMPEWSSELNSCYQHYNYYTLYTIYKLVEINGYALFISQDDNYLYFKLVPYEVVLRQDLGQVNLVSANITVN